MCVFLQKCLPDKLHLKFSAFLKHFVSFFKQIKKMGWKVPPQFFICLHIIGVGADENLIKYLAWPKHPYIVCESREGAGEAAGMFRLV